MTVTTRDVAKAIDRLADAAFQQAKAQQKNNKLFERSVIVQEALLEINRFNSAVTKHLEAELAAKVARERPSNVN